MPRRRNRSRRPRPRLKPPCLTAAGLSRLRPGAAGSPGWPAPSRRVRPAAANAVAAIIEVIGGRTVVRPLLVWRDAGSLTLHESPHTPRQAGVDPLLERRADIRLALEEVAQIC